MQNQYTTTIHLPQLLHLPASINLQVFPFLPGELVDYQPMINAMSTQTIYLFFFSSFSSINPNPHPDPQIRGGGGAWSPKKNFQPFGPQFNLKIRGGVAPPGPSPESATRNVCKSLYLKVKKKSMSSGNSFHWYLALHSFCCSNNKKTHCQTCYWILFVFSLWFFQGVIL